MKSGVVAIIGRPNVGKSTLLNRLVGEKVAIVSSVPQTTRNQVRAIINEPRGQVVFLDTPGLHVVRHALDRAMISAINDAILGADVVLHLVDVVRPLGEEEGMVIARLAEIKVPIILALNKIDQSQRYLGDYLEAWEKKLGQKLSGVTDRVMPVPVSALQGTNINYLVDEIFVRLPDGAPLYPDDVLTDFPRQLTIQDIIREKFLFYLEEELPFSIAVYAQDIQDRSEKLTAVKALILVERESQKGIVIGHKGSLLKKVGEASRKELQELYHKKFYLELQVKVDEDWKQDDQLLKKMGYLV